LLRAKILEERRTQKGGLKKASYMVPTGFACRNRTLVSQIGEENLPVKLQSTVYTHAQVFAK